MTGGLAERDSYAGLIGQSKEEDINSKWRKVEILATMKHFFNATRNSGSRTCSFYNALTKQPAVLD